MVVCAAGSFSEVGELAGSGRESRNEKASGPHLFSRGGPAAFPAWCVMTADIRIHDQWVEHPQGRVFARRWCPSRQPHRAVARFAGLRGVVARWVLDAWIDAWLDPGFAAWSLAGVLPRVRCPVLALHGERDEYGSTRHPELIALHGGGPVRCEILPGIGHKPQRERPEQGAPGGGFPDGKNAARDIRVANAGRSD